MNMTKELSDSLLAACKAAGIEKPGHIAQNANGKVIHHDNQPSRKGWDSIWGGGGIPKRLNHPPYATDWQESLLEWVEQQKATEHVWSNWMIEPKGEPLADVLARHPDHVADTSKMIDMQDAIADAYRKHVGRCGLQTYAQTYRHGWQERSHGKEAAMTDEQINIAIAESLGWESCGMASTGKLMGYKTEEWEQVPNYTSDLNACHEIEKTLEGMNQITYLAKLHENNHYCSWGGTCATALQRCEAYLRTLGKWKE